LFDLAVHIFYLNQSLWLYWSYAGAALPQGVDRLADGMVALMAPALGGESPPPGPYVGRPGRRDRSKRS
jgi:hypothetical protein